MARLKFTISYNGYAYAGWQVQPNASTVQGELEKSLDILLGLQASIVGCGRTDSGVHGKNYIFHADVIRHNPDAVYKLNRMLPKDIVVTKMEEVDNDFHARFNAKSRAYEYHIVFAKEVFESQAYHYQYEQGLDLARLNDLASHFMSCLEFVHFKKAHGSSKTDTCVLTHFSWSKHADGRVVFAIQGDRFLRGMVRLIVGAQLNYHRGKLSLSELDDALSGKAPIQQPWSVPASGLYFVGATY